MRQSTLIASFVKGFHSDWFYKALEAAFDGVIDFKLEDIGKRTATFMRIRSMRNMQFDSEWHQLRLGDNLEVTFQE